MRFIRVAAVVLLMVSALAASNTFDMYVIDLEGSKSSLFVSPSGQSMVIDAGVPGDRDATRIVEACKAAGVKQIDYMVVSHYDGDHVGGVPALAAKIPIVTFVDHGENVQLNDFTIKGVKAYMDVVAKGKHLVVKAGDRIPIKGIDVQVVMAAGKAITAPLKGAGQPNPACDTTPKKVWGPDSRGIVDNQDTNENAMAITVLITYGKYRMVDPADLTWNMDRLLMCPMNRVGTVDLLMTANHGTENANSPVLVHALQPRVVIADNGPRKGATADTFQTVMSSPGLEDYWQGHYLIAGGDKLNTKLDLIANIQDSPDGKWIKVSAEKNGTFTVTNQRNNFSKTYKPKK